MRRQPARLQLLQHGDVQMVHPHAAVFARNDKARMFKDGQMFHHSETRHWQSETQLRCGLRPGRKPIDQDAARGIRQGGPNIRGESGGGRGF
jgi:hypothetical protein